MCGGHLAKQARLADSPRAPSQTIATTTPWAPATSAGTSAESKEPPAVPTPKATPVVSRFECTFSSLSPRASPSCCYGAALPPIVPSPIASPSVSSLQEDIATRSQFKYSTEVRASPQERTTGSAAEWHGLILIVFSCASYPSSNGWRGSGWNRSFTKTYPVRPSLNVSNQASSCASTCFCFSAEHSPFKLFSSCASLLNAIKPGTVTQKIHQTKIPYHQMARTFTYMVSMQRLTSPQHRRTSRVFSRDAEPSVRAHPSL